MANDTPSLLAGDNPADTLRRAAEDALIWQDEWDSQPSDGSAVQNFIDAASPCAVLAALDAAYEQGRAAYRPSDERVPESEERPVCKRFRHDEHCIDEPHA